MSTPHRKKRKQPQHLSQGPIKRKRNAASVMMVLGAVAGLAIGYIAADRNLGWTIGATIIGILVGYLFGHSMDRAAQKTK